jgi:hypothetical protein
MLVEGAMQTPAGAWRVEVVRRRGQQTRWYRIVSGDDDAVLDWLSITAVERILTEAGVDMSGDPRKVSRDARNDPRKQAWTPQGPRGQDTCPVRLKLAGSGCTDRASAR